MDTLAEAYGDVDRAVVTLLFDAWCEQRGDSHLTTEQVSRTLEPLIVDDDAGLTFLRLEQVILKVTQFNAGLLGMMEKDGLDITSLLIGMRAEYAPSDLEFGALWP